MRTDDPIILRRLEEIEAACAGLRMACGFPPIGDLPETTASRAPHWCPVCNGGGIIGFTSKRDLDRHLATSHQKQRAAT